ncbi:MAG: ATP-grasp domain-containing protein [Prosthecobacter sp.]|nr:ATP-grasp domain-containing protein [Prosthecobacter sp.]
MIPCTRILVTAIGGDLAQAIVKALRMASMPCEIHGADMADGLGSLFVNAVHKLPRASDPHYVDRLAELCHHHAIDAVFPASEPEIRVLSHLPAFPHLSDVTRLICQPRAFTSVYGDKLRCFRALAEHVPLAPFADGSSEAETEAFVATHGFPLIVKERESSGGKGIQLVNDPLTLGRILPKFEKPVLQGFIDGEEAEYTIGVYGPREGGAKRLVSLRRRLADFSCTWYAELDMHPEVLEYSRQVAAVADGFGSYNIQLRLSSQGPRLLEINPRFSSLTAARAACGFNDAEWTLREALGLPLPEQPNLVANFRFQRYFAEAVDIGAGYQDLTRLLSTRDITA